MTTEPQIDIIQNAIQAIITDKYLKGTVSTRRDETIGGGAWDLRIIGELFDRVIWVDRPPMPYRADPGVWNGLKRWIPFMKQSESPVRYENHIHHNCPHLPTVGADEHFAWLMQGKSE